MYILKSRKMLITTLFDPGIEPETSCLVIAIATTRPTSLSEFYSHSCTSDFSIIYCQRLRQSMDYDGMQISITLRAYN